MYFRYDGLLKMWLDISLKSPFLEECLTGNMLNNPKHCCTLKDSTVTIFSDHFEGK